MGEPGVGLIRHGVSPWRMPKPLVDEAIDQDPHSPPRGSRCFLPCRASVVRQTLDYTAGIIRRHRLRIGSPWRKLNPGRQALLVLAYLRKGETFAELAAGVRHRHRYRLEICHRDRGAAGGLVHRSCAGRCGRREGRVRLSGHRRHLNPTLIPIDRVAADRPFYSDEHRKHGNNG